MEASRMNDEALTLIRQLAAQAAAQTATTHDPSAWRVQQAIRAVAQVVCDLDFVRWANGDELECYVETYLEAYDAAVAAAQRQPSNT